MLVTLLENVMLVKPQFANVQRGMMTMLSGSMTLVSLAQPLNAAPPRSVTLLAMTTLVRLAHSANIPSPRVVMPFGMATLLRLEKAKTEAPKLVRLSGSVTEVAEE